MTTVQDSSRSDGPGGRDGPHGRGGDPGPGGEGPGDGAGQGARPEAERPGAEGTLSHLSPDGSRARMVDVSAKAVTTRAARARALVRFPAGVLERVRAGQGPKGPIEELARVAGIQAAKRTAEWIPLCHPLGLDVVDIEFRDRDARTLEIDCYAACSGRTGVEMEAMVGASAAALAVYDMTKGLDHGISIEAVELLEKSGGRSGTWRRS